MRQILLSFLLLICPIIGYSQITSIAGKVMVDNIDESTELNGIRILNKQTKEEAITDLEGLFKLNVKPNDDLIITSGFTDKRALKVTEDLIKKGFITIHLDLEVIQLSEATVNTLKPNLKDNIKIIESDKTLLYKKLGLDPSMQFAKVNPYQTSALKNKNFADPSLWISSLSGQRKNDKKINEYYVKADLLKSLKDYFTVNYFINDLNIPEYKVDEFINYCYSKGYFKNLVQNYNYEEITNKFEKEASLYIKLITPLK
jgi:hypothetical protein